MAIPKIFKRKDPLERLLFTPEEQAIFDSGRAAGLATKDFAATSRPYGREPRYGSVPCPRCGRATEHRWQPSELRLFCISCGTRNYRPVDPDEVMCCRRTLKGATDA